LPKSSDASRSPPTFNFIQAGCGFGTCAEIPLAVLEIVIAVAREDRQVEDNPGPVHLLRIAGTDGTRESGIAMAELLDESIGDSAKAKSPMLCSQHSIFCFTSLVTGFPFHDFIPMNAQANDASPHEFPLLSSSGPFPPGLYGGIGRLRPGTADAPASD
jgi:hypothetical protein